MGLPLLRCPICQREVQPDDPNMPFCSDRCRVIDLGNWASEKYVISKPNHPAEFAEDEDLEVGEGPVQ